MLAYWVYRGDIRPGAVVARRNVSVRELERGILKVRDAIQQTGDLVDLAKDTHTPGEAVAAGRVVIRFTEAPTPNEAKDLAPFWDREKKTIRSTTGELLWDYSGQGLSTVNAERSRGFCGFAEGRDLTLGDVAVTAIKTPFAVVCLTSLEEKPIASSSRVLITAVARARNTGMSYSPDGAQLLAIGGPPLQMQGVRATLTVPRPAGEVVVNALDVWGRRTGVTVPFQRAGDRITFQIAPEYKAVYYEIGGAAQKPAAPASAGPAKPDLARGLILHYTFDEAEGDTAVDASGGKRNGRIRTYDGKIQRVEGKSGKALQDGMILFEKDPPTPHAKRLPSYTFALWLKAEPRGYGTIYAEGDVEGNLEQDGFCLGFHTTKALAMRLFHPGMEGAIRAGTNKTEVFDGQWRHVAFVDDAGLVTFYVDGQRLPGGFAYHRPLFFRPRQAAIGGSLHQGKPHPFAGLMDDVRLYDRALSPEEIRMLAGPK